MLDEGEPLFLQIAEQLADDIADGTLAEGDRVPSSNEFAVYHRINPATAAKGINVLVDQGILEKHRGVGMFVVHGARERLLARRREEFAERFVTPLVAEAHRIGLDDNTVLELIRRASDDQPGSADGIGPDGPGDGHRPGDRTGPDGPGDGPGSGDRNATGKGAAR